VQAVTERESLTLGPMAGDRRTSVCECANGRHSDAEGGSDGRGSQGAHEIAQPGPWNGAKGKRSRKNFHRFLFGKGANRPELPDLIRERCNNVYELQVSRGSITWRGPSMGAMRWVFKRQNIPGRILMRRISRPVEAERYRCLTLTFSSPSSCK
jgi:hypothetical protein